ncbi:HGGxSTG domain-containing protein [Novosphingobium sp. CECT 9465]|uniref:HGGxSTG domain-containing protein n=1 Tax=Novosphingobium sp. CECT 9465 TaxID=2829794 RepID=UPI0035300725
MARRSLIVTLPCAMCSRNPCGARRRDGGVCGARAMHNGRCHRHGGKSPGAPRGADNPNWKHGRFSVLPASLDQGCNLRVDRVEE